MRPVQPSRPAFPPTLRRAAPSRSIVRAACSALLVSSIVVGVPLALGASAPASQPQAQATSPTDPPRAPRLVISEVMTDPLLLDDVAGEYVELINLGPTAVQATELELELPSGKRAVPLVAAESVLAPCGVLVLAPQPGPNALMVKAMRLPNRAGRLVVRWRGQVVDVAQWTGRWPWPKHRAGHAIERRSPDADGTRGGSWAHARAALRGVERGSPGVVAWGCRGAEGATASAAARSRSTPRGPEAPLQVARRDQSGGEKPRARSRARISGPRRASIQRRAHSEWRLWEAMATLVSATTSNAAGTAITRNDGSAIASLR